ncbi:MAG: hypothetical protein PVJ92_00815 [Candidatus Dependentiae bacterium]|jgi:hypothetical protein
MAHHHTSITGRWGLLVFFFSFIFQLPLQAVGSLPPVSLPRISKVAIAETTAKLQKDMSKIRWRFGYLVTAVLGTIGVLANADVIPMRALLKRMKAPHGDGSTREDDCTLATNSNAYQARLWRNIGNYVDWNMSWSVMFIRTFLFALAASSAGIIWASWQDTAENASSSLKRWMTGLTKGYKGWLLHESAVLEKNARVMYHSLTYASNSNAPAEQLVTYKPIIKDDDELAHLGYRGDSVRRFEKMYDQVARILALMFLITPKARHAAVQKDVAQITKHLNTLADYVERDINNATSRFIVEYEKETQQSFIGLFEELHARLARYDVVARA